MANRGGTYSWPEAVDGQTVSQMCQYGVVGQNVTRYCNGQIWTEDASICPTVVTKQFKELGSVIQNVKFFENLCTVLTFIYAHQQTISSENVVNVTSQLQTVVSQASEVVDQSSSNLAVVTNVFTQIANISSPSVPVQPEVRDKQASVF